MSIFRANKGWLRFRVLSEIKKEHSDLFLPFWIAMFYKFKEYSFDRNRWWLILIAVILIFCIGAIINIDFLNIIDINSETAKILVDQRAGNIAIITSITLVVVGFLINNLAVKESFAYRLLFTHSYLYPIIYFTLSTICCFFVVSALRDAIEPTRFVNTVLAGTYLALVILLLIGFLFKTIIDFTNDRTIKRLLHNELMSEAKLNLKTILIKKYSSKIFKQTVQECGAEEYNWAEALDFSKSEVEFKELSDEDLIALKKKDKRIYDLNLIGLKKFISKKKKGSGKIFYQDLALEQIVTEYDDYLWQKDNPNTDKDKSKLKSNIVLKSSLVLNKNKDLVRKYFDQKLEILANNSEYLNLENLLDSYYKMYELQMKHQL